MYRGKVKNGMVVFEGAAPPEGAEVRVYPSIAEADMAPVAKKLLKLSGIAKGLPSDLAKNHDHYLHGQPRKP